MKNLIAIKERYLKEPFSRRLGHLASDLARISSFLDNSANLEAVEDILEESKFFIEWTAPEASLDVKVLLSEIQSRLALSQRHLPHQKNDAKEIEELKKATKNWSEQLIEISGLLVV